MLSWKDSYNPIGEDVMNTRKLVLTTARLINLMVVIVMVFGSPLSVLAAEVASRPRQDVVTPALSPDKAEYLTGESVTFTGSGLTAETDYLLAVMDPASDVFTDTFTADTAGAFTYDAYGPLALAGDYAARLYPADWVDD
jgi:hypothetical protein